MKSPLCTTCSAPLRQELLQATSEPCGLWWWQAEGGQACQRPAWSGLVCAQLRESSGTTWRLWLVSRPHLVGECSCCLKVPQPCRHRWSAHKPTFGQQTGEGPRSCHSGGFVETLLSEWNGETGKSVAGTEGCCWAGEVKNWFVIVTIWFHPRWKIEGWSGCQEHSGQRDKPRVKLIPTSWHSCDPGWPEGQACLATKQQSSDSCKLISLGAREIAEGLQWGPAAFPLLKMISFPLPSNADSWGCSLNDGKKQALLY